LFQCEVKKDNILTKENAILLISTLVLSIIADYLLNGKPFGVSYPLFIMSFYVVFLWNCRKNLIYKLNFGWLLSVPILMLSFTYLIYTNEVFRIFNFFAVPILIVAQVLIITEKSKHRWHSVMFFKDILYGFFNRMLVHIPKPVEIVAGWVRMKGGKNRNSVLSKILIGLLFSVPLLIVIISLLVSADMMFDYFVSSIPNIFKIIDIYSFFVHVLFIVILCAISFSFIWSLKNQKKQDTDIINTNSTNLTRFCDPVIIITVLVLMNIIYLVFTAIQFTYLFGGVTPTDVSYSEYARRGFFELIAVTLINLSILLFNINFTKSGTKSVNMCSKVLNSLLIACTMVILYSAHMRMSLYEDTYGYTYLRLFTHAFMIFIFLLLAATLVKIWNKKIILCRAYIIIALISYIAINYVNVDVIIARNNLERYNKSVQVSGDAILDIGYINGIYLPEIKTAFVIDNGFEPNENDKIINTERFINHEIVRLNRAKIRFGKRCCTSLTEGALETLSEIKKIHFALEDIYIAAMDFRRKEEYTKKLLIRIFK
jgi:hypothetical protein